MRLSKFILGNLEPILQEWERFARTIGTSKQALDSTGLRYHAEFILRAIALDIDTPQSASEQVEKSQGLGPESLEQTAAQFHALTRLAAGFSLNQMVSEYRALRASVLRLWLTQQFSGEPHQIADMMRFNEGIDQALTESIASFESALDQTRHVLLGILGHDLRTPLGAVLMGTDLLQRSDKMDDREKRISSQISASGRRANQIVNDLLDLARCNLGAGIPIKKELISLSSVCQITINEVRTCHPEATIVYKDNGPIEGLFDPLRMGQVFTNLLSNAVQHGDPQRAINLSLEANANDVCFTVHNHGDPIPAEVMPMLFSPNERYSQFSESEHGPAAGLGLGLFIASEIVAGHGGRIEVESTLERGTVFRARLPASGQRLKEE
ncbi:HAMP domain-containing histidine kinase [Pseudomonas sp. Fig-3]|uniref:sensor histidine kinase n=1 Tax=unclassified Pseudomonas TaxID=196821 RepID=UPI0010DD09EE|nr:MULTISPECIES: HAMP domain-containing sensor histidine kinase [unclassified Pseudomonas]TNB81449.1 HAMP domain-containing histidine kinase [Pseudomonas sp. Fig-3]VII91557.1 Two-component system sensor histidine kinase [Pseudomonas sp. FG-3G]